MNAHDADDWQMAIRPAETAFFLDVDGTLLGFKERPEDVIADDELHSLLKRLRMLASDAVALVSGRTVEDLDRIMAPLVLPAGGVHGADLRFADRRRETIEGDALADVRERTQTFISTHEGLRFEDKGGTTFALHYRQAPDLADEVARFLDRVIEGRDLMVQHGKMVAEVKPKSCHKGIAIETLMRAPPFAGRVPFFMGDDLTDEHGFASVNRLGGISIKVGEGETIAQHRLAGTDGVRDLLAVICRSGDGEK